MFGMVVGRDGEVVGDGLCGLVPDEDISTHAMDISEYRFHLVGYVESEAQSEAPDR
jgi:hypothetical protein